MAINIVVNPKDSPSRKWIRYVKRVVTFKITIQIWNVLKYFYHKIFV